MGGIVEMKGWGEKGEVKTFNIRVEVFWVLFHPRSVRH